MIVTLDEKRRLTVPLALAPETPGDAFAARFDEEEDAIVFRRVKRGKSWLDVLRACPVFMDDVPARSRALLVQFEDADGHTLKANLDDRGLSAEEHLGQLLFYDGDELRPCRDRRTLAATSPHNSVVFVCSAAFKSAIERNHRLVESILIHEMLHTLGLRENPPTSREITNRVDEACR